jgi:hypothetical protein
MHFILEFRKLIGWQKFDAFSEWADDYGLDIIKHQVIIDHDSMDKPTQRVAYPCDAEFGVTFGDGIAHLFKVYNYCRSRVVIDNYAQENGSTIDFMPYYFISMASEFQSPRACEWINCTLVTKLAAKKVALESQKEKANAAVANE